MRCVKTWPQRVTVPLARGSVHTGGFPACLREREKVQMDAENVVGLVIALALLGYLVVALIRPEKF